MRTSDWSSDVCSSDLFGMTPLAWLRNFEEAPTTANINGLLERLRYVRGIGIDPAIGAKIPDFRFAQFMREGGVAPAFLLSDYSLNRRRATLIAAVIDLDARLADGAIQMFDRLVGSLFPRARRGRSEEHTSELQSLMRIPYAVFCLKNTKKTHETYD